MAQPIPKRSEIDPKYKWKLTDIFPSDEAWEAAFAEAEKAVADYQRYDGHVAEDPKAAIRAYFELEELLAPIISYAHLQQEGDNSDPAAQAHSDRAMGLMVRASTAAAGLEPELLELPEETLRALAAQSDMADYDVFLGDVLRQKPHALPKEQERLMAMSGEIQQAPDHIFSMLSSADMKFPPVRMPDGTEAELTEGVFTTYLHSGDREVRRQAYTGIMDTYGSYGNTIAATYGASVKADVFRSRVYRYSSSRAAAMEPLQIPEAVYDNLVQVIHESLPTLNRYLALRRKALGLDELHMYDLYCPIVQDFEMVLPYEQAFELVLEGLRPMGEDYLAKLREARDNGWIDVFPAQGKSSGAFSMGHLRKVHPYVLLNHNDNLDCAFTIAHELGHSMHSYFSNTHQPAPKSDYSLFVAEVASTCNEVTMMRHLLNTLKEPKAQAYLLNHFLEQFRTTVFRQTMFAEFELITHRMAEQGQPLTREAMNKVYYDLNKTYYGAECHVDQTVENEWARIPHFYRAFYVYVYATGLCAAVSLSDRIVREGESAVRDYRKFLSAGSSVPPIDALKLAGIDMSSPEPIRRAMEVFAQTLDRFEEVLGK